MQLQYLLLGLVFVICGCDADMRSPLYKAGSNLQAGMTKSEVVTNLSNFRLVSEVNRIQHLDWSTNWQTGYLGNKRQAISEMHYARTVHSGYEYLLVYFDANDVIIAWHYNPDG